MSEIITVGLDLAKNVFHVIGADGIGRVDTPHISRTGRALVYVSVWGNPVDFVESPL